MNRFSTTAGVADGLQGPAARARWRILESDCAVRADRISEAGFFVRYQRSMRVQMGRLDALAFIEPDLGSNATVRCR
jgi:hypothetical protein